MKNLHLLPTEKPSILGRFIDTNNLFLRVTNDIPRGENINIYITSDEQIKDGDWVVFNELEIVKCTYSKNGEFLFSEPLTSSSNHHFSYFKKIILTTDLDLIKNSVQAIDDEFLEWFVKNPNCREIEVVDVRSLGVYGSYYPYKIIIPKEDTKQETLEEAAERIFDGFGDITKPIVIKRAIELVKCQQERMYSEEEVYNLLTNALWDLSEKGYSQIEFDKWFEKHKKK